MHFGIKVYYYRKSLNMTQASLAERVGINSATLSRIEKGVLTPSFDTALKLVKALDAPNNEFFPLLNTTHEMIKSKINYNKSKKIADLALELSKMNDHQRALFDDVFDKVLAAQF